MAEPRGFWVSSSKLTEDQVRSIIAAGTSPGKPLKAARARFLARHIHKAEFLYRISRSGRDVRMIPHRALKRARSVHQSLLRAVRAADEAVAALEQTPGVPATDLMVWIGRIIEMSEGQGPIGGTERAIVNVDVHLRAAVENIRADLEKIRAYMAAIELAVASFRANAGILGADANRLAEPLNVWAALLSDAVGNSDDGNPDPRMVAVHELVQAYRTAFHAPITISRKGRGIRFLTSFFQIVDGKAPSSETLIRLVSQWRRSTTKAGDWKRTSKNRRRKDRPPRTNRVS